MAIMNCTELAQGIKDSLAQSIQRIHKQYAGIKHPWPKVLIVTSTDDEAVQRYLCNKTKDFKEVGIRYTVLKYGEPADPEVAIDAIRQANVDDSINGIMVQLPFSTTVNVNRIIDAISPAKDVDGLTSMNAGYLWKDIQPKFLPCTPKGVMTILKNWNVPIAGQPVCIIGRSNIVSRPLAGLLINRGAMVSVCHSQVPKKLIVDTMKRSTIIISAIGQPHYWIKYDFTPGTTIIDVGINMLDGKLCGDFSTDCINDAGLITPVPGGVGLMTRAMLCQNIVEAWAIQNDFGTV